MNFVSRCFSSFGVKCDFGLKRWLLILCGCCIAYLWPVISFETSAAAVIFRRSSMKRHRSIINSVTSKPSLVVAMSSLVYETFPFIHMPKSLFLVGKCVEC